MKIGEKNGPMHVIELEHEDQVQLVVPASMGRTCVYLEVNLNGELEITGGSSVIGKISGKDMKRKAEEC
jgi:hypothetical protein